MSQVTRPQIPYRGPVHGGLHDGKRIEIKGQVPYGADLFQVNLLTGHDSCSDRPLHISVRFNGRVVVRNALQQNSYGAEERYGPFPFKHGGDFTMMISVNHAAYRIDVNGQNCWLFSHRIPFTRVSSIFIDGDVRIERIQFINKMTPVRSPVSSPVNLSYQPTAPAMPIPLGNHARPCIFPIYGGLKPNMLIHITAQPTVNPHKFTINLQNGSNPMPPDISLHMDVRFYNRSIIRNSRNKNSWGGEENYIPIFPFFQSVSFLLIIKVLPDRYEVLVENQPLFTFYHRLHNLSHFNIVYIENLIITSIRYQ